jgi:GNAT superfamily N-acetyltransferase
VFTLGLITYRKLEKADIPEFIAMRLEQLQEEGANPTIDLEPSLYAFYEKHVNDGTFISWLAVDGEKVIATSGMSFVEKPPYYSNPTGKIGLLSSMFTLKPHRRKGIAKELLDRVIDEARQYGCSVVHITASDMGVYLYREYGFVKNLNFMEFEL